VPVVIDLWANASEPSKQLKQTLEKVTRELGGRVVLAHLDVEQNPRIAATLGGQSVPAVLALLKGQGFPLLQGPAPEADVRRLFDELLQVAASNGVTGSVGAGEDAEAPLSPLHQAGYDALERGELAAAKEAFAQALAEAPADELAKAALAQVELLERLEAADGATDPAAATDSLQGTLAAADADVAAGNFAQGFNRLLSAMAGAVPEDKEALRVRLLSLFDVAGPAEAAVIQARRRLAGLLF
jgi:putative thioredoxin